MWESVSETSPATPCAPPLGLRRFVPKRRTRRASPVPDFDPGPPPALEAHLAAVPAPPVAKQFWVDWGPVFYRGRLDGSARVLCVASDPGPTERIAGRTLVGNAGQRVQGFLTKLGLTRSYLCLNAWPYALHPAWSMPAKATLDDPAQADWRNGLYD